MHVYLVCFSIVISKLECVKMDQVYIAYCCLYDYANLSLCRQCLKIYNFV